MIKKTQEQIAESLTGFYKPDQLYLLESNYDSFCFFDKHLEKVDAVIASLLNSFPLKKEETAVCPDSTKSKYPHQGKNDLRTEENLKDILYRIMGVDMTSIIGMQANTILQIISEVGTDMSKFPTADHFASYLGFVPHHKITGGVILSSKTDQIKSSVAQAFKRLFHL